MLQKKLKMTTDRDHLSRIILDQRDWFRIVWHRDSHYFLLKDIEDRLLKVAAGADPEDSHYSDELPYKQLLDLDAYKPLDTSNL